MDKKEREIFLKFLEEKKAAVTSSPEASIAYLKKIGIVNSRGRIAKEFKHLCIPQGQD
ncbi:hypothetical protein [uncultured Fibrella sp.]|uniref:hypothetical protein n=1 Tax=uncultured Fibrella sp. TaxID=1284596 RepID=UPI0035CBD4D1